MESPFVTVNRTLAEHPNAFDDLRIIAGGSGRLDSAARDIIRAAADELESTQRLLISVQAQLIESQRRRIATNEQLIEARKTVRPLAHWQMSSGWVKVEAPK